VHRRVERENHAAFLIGPCTSVPSYYKPHLRFHELGSFVEAVEVMWPALKILLVGFVLNGSQAHCCTSRELPPVQGFVVAVFHTCVSGCVEYLTASRFYAFE